MNLDQKIEAFLFLKGEPISIKKMCEFLEADKYEISEALALLDEKLKDRGLQLIYKEDGVLLGTRNELGSLLEKIRKEELNKELSKASLETLSIILYKNGATRSDIDYVRGVNSGFILRNLLIRGLIEKAVHLKDSRKYFYKPTFELLGYLGVSKVEDLPEYADMQKVVNKNIEEIESAEENLA